MTKIWVRSVPGFYFIFMFALKLVWVGLKVFCKHSCHVIIPTPGLDSPTQASFWPGGAKVSGTISVGPVEAALLHSLWHCLPHSWSRWRFLLCLRASQKTSKASRAPLNRTFSFRQKQKVLLTALQKPQKTFGLLRNAAQGSIWSW